MRRETLDLLACPACRSEVRIDDERPIADAGDIAAGKLTCVQCDAEYTIERGVPRLMPREVPAQRWDEWEGKQELGIQEYTAEASETDDYFDRIATEFGVFCAFTGTIVDIGCGIASSPPYAIRPPDSLFIGVDPLESDVDRTFEFVEGVGERLPFRDAVFDWAIAATSLDHFAAPELVLDEIRRVLTPGGALGLWVGVLDPRYFEKSYALPSLRDPETRQRVVEVLRHGGLGRISALVWQHAVADRIRSLVVRIRRVVGRPLPVADYFEDRARYHFHFYSEPEVVDLLQDCGFRIERRRLIEDIDHGNSLFVVASSSEVGFK